MKTSDSIRVGIVGMGNAGTHHARYLAAGQVPGARLAACCDPSLDETRKSQIINLIGANSSDISFYQSAEEMIHSGSIDAAIIATPHPLHAEVAIQAFDAGLHVMVEKPIAAHIRDARRIEAAALRSQKAFGVMFSQRNLPIFKKTKDLVDSGEIGEIHRVVWIATDWFRPQAYFDSGSWRATWKREGGGILINQAPHTLDLLQWICGMPTRIRAHCGFGRHHHIETEDDVTAFFEYENKATGTFIASTGEAPGTNRLEISGDRGKITVEGQSLTLWRCRQSTIEFNKTATSPFDFPETWRIPIEVEGKNEFNLANTKNFINSISKGEKLIAPGTDGTRSLQMSNAILLSAWTDRWIELPLDEDSFMEQFEMRTRSSSPRPAKQLRRSEITDLNQSFRRSG